MNQIFADNDRGVSLEKMNGGTVFIYDDDYYMRTQEIDNNDDIVCVRLRDGYVVHLTFNKKLEIFTGTLRMECSQQARKWSVNNYA